MTEFSNYDVMYYNQFQNTAVISREPILNITIDYGNDFYASFPLHEISSNCFRTTMTQKLDLSGFLDHVYADNEKITVEGFDIFKSP